MAAGDMLVIAFVGHHLGRALLFRELVRETAEAIGEANSHTRGREHALERGVCDLARGKGVVRHDRWPFGERHRDLSLRQRLAFGERAGQRVRRIGAGFGVDGEAPTLTGPRCASVQGFSVHANTQVPAHRRDQLERLIRYTARGAVSLERLTQDAYGDLVYTFTHPRSDGTTGMRLAPLELLEKLAALVPLPRMHLVRYGGCLAPHSHLRGAIIPTPRQQGMEDEGPDTGSPRWNWAHLLQRVFALDMAHCPFCQQGTRRIMAAITQGEVIRTILQHLKLAVDSLPIAPARVRQDACAWFSA
jgi:hypothetical protein